MIKRILTLSITFALLLACCVPGIALAAEVDSIEPVAAGTSSGFQIDDASNEKANSYWGEVDIYTLFNSADSGFLVTSFFEGSLDYYSGLYLDVWSSPGFPVIRAFYRNTISPYTSAIFPLGHLVTFTSYNGALSDKGSVYRNYSEAEAAWIRNANSCYFLTPSSYIGFYSKSSYLGGAYLFELGLIDNSGTVSYGRSLCVYALDKSEYFSYNYGLYSDVAALPDPTPTVPVFTTDLPGGGWNYIEQGSSAPTLTVSAESQNNGIISYQWYVYDCNSATTAKAIPGATSNSYTPPTDTVGQYVYNCTVTNTYLTGSNSLSSTGYCISVYASDQSVGDGITWTLTDDGILIISGNGEIPSHNRMDYPWFPFYNEIVSVVISEGITVIPGNCFNDYNNIESVSLPSTLLKIEKYSFYSCDSLKQINLPRSLVSIGNSAFDACKSLTYIFFPPSLQFLDSRSFSYCGRLKSVYFYSATPPVLSETAFMNSGDLSSIFVPYGTSAAYKASPSFSAYADIIIEMAPEADPVTTLEEVKLSIEKILAELEEIKGSTSLLAQILDAINSWGQAIVDAIGSMGDNIGEALTEAIVPSDEAMQEMTDNSEAMIADRFGAVYEGAQMIDQWAGQLQAQTAKPTLIVPEVTVNLAGVPFSFGGWEVDVVPKGFEFLAETCAFVIDIVATIAFLNSLRRRLERTLEG